MLIVSTDVPITRQVHQWTFKNDGLIFRGEDWSRLKKIGPNSSIHVAYSVDLYST